MLCIIILLSAEEDSSGNNETEYLALLPSVDEVNTNICVQMTQCNTEYQNLDAISKDNNCIKQDDEPLSTDDEKSKDVTIELAIL